MVSVFKSVVSFKVGSATSSVGWFVHISEIILVVSFALSAVVGSVVIAFVVKFVVLFIIDSVVSSVGLQSYLELA